MVFELFLPNAASTKLAFTKVELTFTELELTKSELELAKSEFAWNKLELVKLELSILVVHVMLARTTIGDRERRMGSIQE